MLKRSRRPLLARLLNFGDRVLRAVHIPRDALTPESARADAAQVTRLSATSKMAARTKSYGFVIGSFIVSFVRTGSR